MIANSLREYGNRPETKKSSCLLFLISETMVFEEGWVKTDGVGLKPRRYGGGHGWWRGQQELSLLELWERNSSANLKQK